MKTIIQKIFQKELKIETHSIKEIIGLGEVNRVFEVKGKDKDYIIRLNKDDDKKIEYQKEKWCLDKVGNLGIPSPTVLAIGFQHDFTFMIQNKISGINGIKCTAEEKKIIWKTLGSYVARFQQFSKFDNKAIEDDNFHQGWKNKLNYNIKELNEKDSLFQKKILTRQEQNKAKEILASLLDKDFQIGLMHGDLCPRNAIWNEGIVYLLDWGTAEMDIVPHMEIGNILIHQKASEEEFQLFLEGLGITTAHFKKIEKEINTINLLDRLDKYRWAEDHQVPIIEQYEEKIRTTFDKVNEN